MEKRKKLILTVTKYKLVDRSTNTTLQVVASTTTTNKQTSQPVVKKHALIHMWKHPGRTTVTFSWNTTSSRCDILV